METDNNMVDRKIIMAASHDLLGTLAEIMVDTEDSKQYAAASIMMNAGFALRDTVRLNEPPLLFDTKINNIKEILEGLENDKE